MRRLLLPSLLASASLLAACGDDPTSPLGESTVTVVVDRVSPPATSVDPDGFPTIACVVDISASSVGNVAPAWQDAVFYWYAGRDRSTPVDSSIVEAHTITESWDTPLSARSTAHSQWTFTAYAPFAVEMSFRYRADASPVKSARARFECGPSVPANPQPPTIVELAVPADSASLEPSQEIAISYRAQSPLGVWRTGVFVSGACSLEQLFNEGLQTNVVRTVRLVLPDDCLLGSPITITVAVLDAALQESYRSLTTTHVLRDATPPHVLPWLLPRWGGSNMLEFSGDYFVGDTILVMPTAWDNGVLRTVGWEVVPTGQRDSVMGGPGDWGLLRIPVTADWLGVGPVTLRFWSRDASGNTSETVTPGGSGFVIRPTADVPVRVATVAGEIRDFVIDSKRGKLYLAQANQARIAVFSLATMQVESTLDVGSPPVSLDLTASGDSLIFTRPASGALGVVNLAVSPLVVTNLAVPAIDIAGGQRQAQVRVASNGKALVGVEGLTLAAWRLLEVDLATGASRWREDAGNAGVVGHVMMEDALDHSAIVINGLGAGSCIQRYDAASDAMSPCRVPNLLGPPSPDLSASLTLVGLDLFDRDLQPVRHIPSLLPGGIPYSALSADGTTVYAALGGIGLLRSSASDGSVIDRIRTPIPWGAMRFSRDGHTLVLVESNYGTTSRIAVFSIP